MAASATASRVVPASTITMPDTPSGSVTSPSTRWAGVMASWPELRADSWAATTTLRARGVKRLKPASPSDGLSAPGRGTNRFCTACLVTPMLEPIWVHDAPERRAWSTKWPTRWSPTSPRCSAVSIAVVSCSSGSVCTVLIVSMSSSSRTVGGMEGVASAMRQPYVDGGRSSTTH